MRRCCHKPKHPASLLSIPSAPLKHLLPLLYAKISHISVVARSCCRLPHPRRLEGAVSARWRHACPRENHSGTSRGYEMLVYLSAENSTLSRACSPFFFQSTNSRCRITCRRIARRRRITAPPSRPASRWSAGRCCQVGDQPAAAAAAAAAAAVLVLVVLKSAPAGGTHIVLAS